MCTLLFSSIIDFVFGKQVRWTVLVIYDLRFEHTVGSSLESRDLDDKYLPHLDRYYCRCFIVDK